MCFFLVVWSVVVICVLDFMWNCLFMMVCCLWACLCGWMFLFVVISLVIFLCCWFGVNLLSFLVWVMVIEFFLMVFCMMFVYLSKVSVVCIVGIEYVKRSVIFFLLWFIVIVCCIFLVCLSGVLVWCVLFLLMIVFSVLWWDFLCMMVGRWIGLIFCVICYLFVRWVVFMCWWLVIILVRLVFGFFWMRIGFKIFWWLMFWVIVLLIGRWMWLLYRGEFGLVINVRVVGLKKSKFDFLDVL